MRAFPLLKGSLDFSDILRIRYYTRVRIQLVQSLLDEQVVSADHLVLDSCPILTKVRQNNLKTPSTQRFEKTQPPKGDPDARVGVLVHFSPSPKKVVRYFWAIGTTLWLMHRKSFLFGKSLILPMSARSTKRFLCSERHRDLLCVHQDSERRCRL